MVSNVSKTQDELYLVDAARSVAEPADLVPPALAAWETHRPPREVPSQIAPAPDLVVARRPYRPLKNLDHVVTVPFPYWTQEATGVGLATLWFEPLGKHAFAAAAGVAPAALRRESFLTATYRNATLGPTLDATVYRFPGAARVYGPDVLVERLTGLDLRVTKPLDLGRTPYTAAQVGALVRVARSEPLNAGEFLDVATTEGLATPRGGTQASVTLAWARRTERPFAGSTIHPLDGFGVRTALTGGAGLDRRTAYGQADLAGYAILPGLGLHRFLVYGRAQGQVGETLPQEYLGLARYDDLQITLPAFIPITLDRNERVRGFRRYAVGKAVAFGTVEYRMPLLNLNTTVLGQVGLGATSLALFADGALVGKDLAFRSAVRRAGVGAEVKNVLRVAALRFGHALGVAQPADKAGVDRPYEVYYRIRLGVPF